MQPKQSSIVHDISSGLVRSVGAAVVLGVLYPLVATTLAHAGH